jgi:hypothetical protein
MRSDTTGIILCKYFHKIHSELLDIFYSYMHCQSFNKIKLFFIIITEHISFIPDNILNNSQIVSIPRPPIGSYNKCVNSIHPNKNIHVYANVTNLINEIIQEQNMNTLDENSSDDDTCVSVSNHYSHPHNPSSKQKKTNKNSINSHHKYDARQVISVSENYKNLTSLSNIKNVIVNTNELTNPHECICNNIIESIKNPDTINYLKFRDILYEILIYDLDINECIWYILSCLIKTQILNKGNITDVLLKTFIFFQYYNNNYRPIYHLENYMYNLITTINGYKTCT